MEHHSSGGAQKRCAKKSMAFDPVTNPLVQAVGESGCWIWLGGLAHGGHGRNGSGYLHRLAYQSVHGDIPEGLCVCHRCDIPSCINPDHLWLGTREENTADRDRKNRHVPHSLGGPKVHSNELIAEIFQATGTVREIAKRYDVSIAHVSHIKTGKRRRHVTQNLTPAVKSAPDRKSGFNLPSTARQQKESYNAEY